mgnify:CR=1 FL=1
MILLEKMAQKYHKSVIEVSFRLSIYQKIGKQPCIYTFICLIS